ncbi:heavy-metal-associated domain-containing protein [Pseudonocardia sp. KRD-184]|uniref:Heavy-metal-associated domain-containing protein n=1 Tax=Pseudonocardia oceani TaxID=2792013 RepID=A0ABS6U897_9PSEU|nr:heavy metal-associated domain-containing protein [Pseudonocardia oceani]MBW0099809.1 heavy-metal-associated domain-containing protein [Pseudonocardia oceani]MBW0124892.1 heavy-metal-associated domain-containing protein [Pseudonocardia oceani]MBW0126642.1 heavy-metal-associated domain-containing protein [Pseudonocardia oceani]MBW0128433.1 heavy-metal-associated domain-containing protein [Pseudonocardia oceani]
MQTLRVSVPAMSCRHCVRAVSRHLCDVPGVETITADAAAGIVTLRGTMTVAEVVVALREAGFPASALP